MNNFKAELFNADEWAQLIASSGAQYVVPTSKVSHSFYNYMLNDGSITRDLLYGLAHSLGTGMLVCTLAFCCVCR